MFSKLRLTALVGAIVIASCVSVSATTVDDSSVKKVEEKAEFDARIARLLKLRQDLGIFSTADRVKMNKPHSEIHHELVQRLEKYPEIEDRLAAVMGYSSIFNKPHHILLNENFDFPMSTEDRNYVDGLYMAYLMVLNEDVQHLDLDKGGQELQTALDNMSVKTAYKFYLDDLKKIRQAMQ